VGTDGSEVFLRAVAEGWGDWGKMQEITDAQESNKAEKLQVFVQRQHRFIQRLSIPPWEIR